MSKSTKNFIVNGKLFRGFCFSALFLALAVSLSAQGAAKAGPKDPLSSGEITALSAGLDASVSTAIAANPAKFESLLREVLSGRADLVQLVDKNVGLASDYVPDDLVTLETVSPKLSLNQGSLVLKFRRLGIPALQEMSAAARKDGVVLQISSSYRSYEYQKNLFARYVKEDGKTEAERESAHEGHSQHQLGLAIDFGSITEAFATSAAGKWLFAHAWEYGFSLSYPKGYEQYTGYMYEPWHYRYIGKPAAALEHEFFGGIQQRLLVFLYDNSKVLKTRFGL